MDRTFLFQHRRQKVTSYGLKIRSNGTFLTTLSCLLHPSIGAINETLPLQFCRLQSIEIQKACVSGLRNSSILQIMNLRVGKMTIMDPPRLLLFLYPFLTLHLLGVAVLAQPGFLYSFCIDSAGNYTDNSTYKANLNTLLSSLSSNNEIDYGFYNFSEGQNSDKVNAIALCRGDVMPDACRSCLNDSRLQLTKLCPNQKAAIGWYEKCMLRYSNESIFGTAQTSPSFYMWNTENVSNVEEFNQVLGNLMASLRSKAASGDWRHKFATGEANVTSFQSIYGLMQCNPDLSESSCSNCLEGATNEIPACCDSKEGGSVVRPSCNLRFEAYRFYEFTAANAPPPAATPPPSPSSADLAPPPLDNTTSAQGKKSNTSRTVVLIVIPSAVISVMLITLICCFFKRRRPRESVAINASIISANINNVPVLNGSNFEKWKEHITILLGCMDLDYAIRTERPPALTNGSTTEQKANFEKWERSNRMSLMIMKHSIPDTIRGAMTEDENAKSFLSQIADRFVGLEKVEMSTILSKLVSMRYKGKGNIREYIMEMSNLVTRLRALQLELSDDILMHLVLISLPTQFGPFKISYNTQKEKWTLNELITQCVQEEERLKQEKVESACLATSSHDNATNRKRKRNNSNKGKKATNNGISQPKVQHKQDKVITCFFCKKGGHVKKDCPKYAKWLVKRGLSRELSAN